MSPCLGGSTPPPESAPDLLASVARSPRLAAARQRIDASLARIDASGRLPDPEIMGMASRANVPASSDMSMWELNLTQPLPRRDERDADRQRARAAVSLAEADYALAAAELAADIATALAEADDADARADLLAAQSARLEASLKTLETRLAAGLPTRLADRLTLQTRRDSLLLQVEQLRLAAANARDTARSRLALPADAPLPAFSAPSPADISASDTAAVASSTARAAEASAIGRVARAGANPMTSVGLRFERERSAMGSQNTLGLAFSSEIPFRTRRYARAEIRAAEADRAAANADADAARHLVSAALARVARADRLAELARKLAADTRTRLDNEHETLSRTLSVAPAMSSSMSGGDSAVLHAVDILDRTSETQLQIVEAETAARLARAELWRHVPASRLLRLAHSPAP